MITKELGERIREFRSKTGLSQEKFALSIGMDRTYFALFLMEMVKQLKMPEFSME